LFHGFFSVAAWKCQGAEELAMISLDDEVSAGDVDSGNVAINNAEEARNLLKRRVYYAGKRKSNIFFVIELVEVNSDRCFQFLLFLNGIVCI